MRPVNNFRTMVQSNPRQPVTMSFRTSQTFQFQATVHLPISLLLDESQPFKRKTSENIENIRLLTEVEYDTLEMYIDVSLLLANLTNVIYLQIIN